VAIRRLYDDQYLRGLVESMKRQYVIDEKDNPAVEFLKIQGNALCQEAGCREKATRFSVVLSFLGASPRVHRFRVWCGKHKEVSMKQSRVVIARSAGEYERFARRGA